MNYNLILKIKMTKIYKFIYCFKPDVNQLNFYNFCKFQSEKANISIGRLQA